MQHRETNDKSVATDVAALSSMAMDHFKKGRLQQAKEVCQQILRKKQRPDVILILGMIAHEQREFEAAVERYKQFLGLMPNHKKTHFKMGLVLEELGRTEPAIEHYKKSIGIAADNVAALRKLGDACSKLKRWDEAIEAYQQVLALQADDVVTIIKLGNVFYAAQLMTKTILLYEKALALLPDDSELHRNLGAAQQKMGQTKKAIDCFEQALRLRPDHIGARNDLALLLRQLDRAEEALVQFDQVIDLKPDDVDAHINVALTHRQLDQAQLAVERLEQFLSIRPTCGEAYYQISIMRPMQELIPVVEKLAGDPALPNGDAMYCHFALGNLLNGGKFFDKAFDHFLKANKLHRATYSFDPAENSHFFDRTIKVFSKHFFKRMGKVGSESQLPVFIVGLPRSGTTLVEQILCSHAQVHGAGELQAIPAISLSIAQHLSHAGPPPECMSHIDKKMVEEHAAQYFQELAFHCPPAERITDKQPGNFVKIGLIKTLFPNAHIIHCQRSPLDNCISLFFHCFMALKCSFDLPELGQYYLQYQRLMSHWHKLFPDEIFNVQYEELVMNQETVSKQLVDFIGLEWDEKCMDFHTNKRPVMSPSNFQVRQPMYKTSIDRWKHYEKHLQPLIEVLQQAQ